MVHSGYEASAVNHTFSGWGAGIVATVKAMMATPYVDPDAAAKLAEERKKPHGPLVQLGIAGPAREREALTV
jgi:hypothetical protein